MVKRLVKTDSTMLAQKKCCLKLFFVNLLDKIIKIYCFNIFAKQTVYSLWNITWKLLDGVGQTNVGSVRINGSIGPGGLRFIKIHWTKWRKYFAEITFSAFSCISFSNGFTHSSINFSLTTIEPQKICAEERPALFKHFSSSWAASSGRNGDGRSV